MDSSSFPPPRRLGRTFTGLPKINTCRRKTCRVDICPVADGGVDEPDSGPPAKKPKLHPHSGRRQNHVAAVETFGKPLKSFSFFIPPKLPASIIDSSSALQEFVELTCINNLKLFHLNKEVQTLDTRLPLAYQKKLGANTNFFKKLLSSIFHEIQYVQSIKTFYAPKIIAPSEIHLGSILEVFKDQKINHLYLPLELKRVTNKLKSTIDSIKSIDISKLTLVADTDEMKKLCKKLADSLQGSCTVSCRSKTPREPGPEYLVEEETEDEEEDGYIVKPLSLARSINAYNSSEPTKEKPAGFPGDNKKKTRTACSTDCTYYSEADLADHGSFTSEIWNLQAFHDVGIDGRGTTIAIVDSGISYIHPAFKNRILAVKNFVRDEADDRDCVIDSDGHGSLCAGIAAGSSFYCPTSESPDSRCMKIPPGVAPGSKIIACKVVKTSDGTVDSDAFVESLLWLKKMHTSGKYHIDVISISLSSTFYHQPRASVISELTATGIIVVSCASNVGRLLRQPISFPGRLGHVLCVGAHDGNGKPTSFSPVGRELDFLCPGEDIWGPGCGTEGPFVMDCASGTSCATPGLAGLVCLVLNAVDRMCKKNPTKFTIGSKSLLEHVHNVWVMRELLKEMSSSPGHHSDEIGYGSLDPRRLLLRSDEEIMRVIDGLIEDE